MAKWKGTTVPNTGYVEKIYFNINLSVEEVVAILDNIEMKDVATDFMSEAILVSSNKFISIMKQENDYIILDMLSSPSTIYFSTLINEELGITFTGWNTEIDYPVYINADVHIEEENGDGVDVTPIGTQNDLITSLFSITSFEEVEPITDLPKFLEANADAIRYAKGTSEKINAQNFAYEIKKLKKISVEPLSITQNGTYTAPEGSAYSPVEVNVPSENTLKKLLDATKSCYYLFSGYSGINVESFISYDDTSNVTNMDNMFNGCPNITTIPQLNTSNVRNMDNMFSNCPNITTIPQLDTSKVTSMLWIFNACSKLKSILMYGMKVSFDISSSTQFEREDLVTILNNLATVTTSKTLTMGATNLAKLTDEDKEIAIAKGWTLA